MNTDIELMKRLEGFKTTAYDCTAGKRTIGIGFNMESVGARKVWDKLQIPEDFDKVFYKEQELSEDSAIKLFNKTWNWCKKQASSRASELNLDYNSMPPYKKFILADIAYNTGSVKKWHKVFIKKNPEEVLYEARRNPKEILDSRVAKIGYYFGIINSIEDAKKIGIQYVKFIV